MAVDGPLDGTGRDPTPGLSNGQTIDTNSVPVASVTGIRDYLFSQGEGYSIDASDNLWFLVGVMVLVGIVVVVILHGKKAGWF